MARCHVERSETSPRGIVESHFSPIGPFSPLTSAARRFRQAEYANARYLEQKLLRETRDTRHETRDMRHETRDMRCRSCLRSPVSGLWSPVSGLWSLVSGLESRRDVGTI